MAVTSRRGKIGEFSDSSQRRLRRKLAEFTSATTEGRVMAVTLTTALTDARKAKLRLKLWADNMRHAYKFAGIYCVEFNRAGGVHFHLTLRFFDDVGTEELRRDCFRRWRRFNPHFCPDAGDFKPADDAEGWNAYIAKRNEQKTLRGLIGGDGLGGTWWGVFNKRLFRGINGAVPPVTVRIPVNEQEPYREKVVDFQLPASISGAA